MEEPNPSTSKTSMLESQLSFSTLNALEIVMRQVEEKENQTADRPQTSSKRKKRRRKRKKKKHQELLVQQNTYSSMEPEYVTFHKALFNNMQSKPPLVEVNDDVDTDNNSECIIIAHNPIPSISTHSLTKPNTPIPPSLSKTKSGNPISILQEPTASQLRTTLNSQYSTTLEFTPFQTRAMAVEPSVITQETIHSSPLTRVGKSSSMSPELRLSQSWTKSTRLSTSPEPKPSQLRSNSGGPSILAPGLKVLQPRTKSEEPHSMGPRPTSKAKTISETPSSLIQKIYSSQPNTMFRETSSTNPEPKASQPRKKSEESSSSSSEPSSSQPKIRLGNLSTTRSKLKPSQAKAIMVELCSSPEPTPTRAMTIHGRQSSFSKEPTPSLPRAIAATLSSLSSPIRAFGRSMSQPTPQAKMAADISSCTEAESIPPPEPPRKIRKLKRKPFTSKLSRTCYNNETRKPKDNSAITLIKLLNTDNLSKLSVGEMLNDNGKSKSNISVTSNERSDNSLSYISEITTDPNMDNKTLNVEPISKDSSSKREFKNVENIQTDIENNVNIKSNKSFNITSNNVKDLLSEASRLQENRNICHVKGNTTDSSTTCDLSTSSSAMEISHTSSSLLSSGPNSSLSIIEPTPPPISTRQSFTINQLKITPLQNVSNPSESVQTKSCQLQSRHEDLDKHPRIIIDDRSTKGMSMATVSEVAGLITKDIIMAPVAPDSLNTNTEILRPEGETCLQAVVKVFQQHFGGSTEKNLEILQRNSFNLLRSLVELQNLPHNSSSTSDPKDAE